MSEILISLTIIGIIAAITLPSLVGNIKEKSWATQRKALYSRITQAISMLPSLNGYGVNEDETITAQNAAQAFITNGLSKVLQISNICDNQNLKKCGLPDNIKTIDGSGKISTPTSLSRLNAYVANTKAYEIPALPEFNYSYSIINTNSAGFETESGESILIFYNPYCLSNEMLITDSRVFYPVAPYMCANFIYDLNGRKGPNQVGKDIGFMAALYSVNTEVVAPNFFKKDLDVTPNTYAEANVACRNAGGRLPNIEEGIMFFVNRSFLSSYNDYIGKHFHLQVEPSLRNIPNTKQSININYGYISTFTMGTSNYKIRCVEK